MNEPDKDQESASRRLFAEILAAATGYEYPLMPPTARGAGRVAYEWTCERRVDGA